MAEDWSTGLAPHFPGGSSRHSLPTPGHTSASLWGAPLHPNLRAVALAQAVLDQGCTLGGGEERGLVLTFLKKGSCLCSVIVSVSLLSWMGQPQGQVTLGTQLWGALGDGSLMLVTSSQGPGSSSHKCICPEWWHMLLPELELTSSNQATCSLLAGQQVSLGFETWVLIAALSLNIQVTLDKSLPWPQFPMEMTSMSESTFSRTSDKYLTERSLHQKGNLSAHEIKKSRIMSWWVQAWIWAVSSPFRSAFFCIGMVLSGFLPAAERCSLEVPGY